MKIHLMISILALSSVLGVSAMENNEDNTVEVEEVEKEVTGCRWEEIVTDIESGIGELKEKGGECIWETLNRTPKPCKKYGPYGYMVLTLGGALIYILISEGVIAT